MRKILLTLVAVSALISAQAASVQPENDTVDTLRTAVVTGTRVTMERDRVPAPLSVIGRQTIEQRDHSALLPSLMEEVPGLTGRT